MSKLHYVNTLQGTESEYAYSNGNTLPLTALPNGMAAWSPQSDEGGGGWFFHPSSRRFEGLRLTHQPSPWIRDYGHLVLMPQTGSLRLSPEARVCAIEPGDLVSAPDCVRVDMREAGAAIELAPTMRCASIRLRFADRDAARLIVAPPEGETSVAIDAETSRIFGYTKAHYGEVAPNFAMYFVLKFDCGLLPEDSGTFDDACDSDHALARTGERAGAFAALRVPSSGVVHCRISTSFISVEQAERNLQSEIGQSSFGEVCEAARESWEKRLGVVDAEDDNEELLRTFYSCLYRINLFPRALHEVDENGRTVHYSPFDGRIHEGPLYVDFGFWDLYRTSLPLYALMYPSLLGEMAEGWVNIYKESGWMPKWPSPGERSAMPGTLVDAAFADMLVKGIRGFDVRSAYEGLRKHAATEAADELLGRRGLGAYKRHGYLPYEEYHESVSNSLDYHYGDFCLAQLAGGLGLEEDRRYFLERSGGYGKLFDSETGFMRGRSAAGEWKEPFDPLEWGGEYCEGGAWQCSWAVPHDAAGLAELAGGKDAFERKLDELMTAEPAFKPGAYGQVIHEMSEMAAAELGQFAISNQPSFHFPYLYAAIGRPEKAQYWARQAAERLFGSGTDGFPGDEDNGSTGAWFVWNAIGLYPFCPGVPEYVIGSPLLRKATIRLENGSQCVVESIGNGPDKPYWSSLAVDGEPWSKLFIEHGRLTAGARLRFEMTDRSERIIYDDAELPFSASLRPRT